MLTTCPCFAFRRSGRHARVIHIRPSTLTFHIPIQSSSTALSMGARPSAPPALLTRTSVRPYFLATSRTNALMLFWSVTSRAIARPSSPATRFRWSNRRAPTTIWNPRRPSATAVAAPMPDEAPVMTATWVALLVSLPPHTPVTSDHARDSVKAYPRQNAGGSGWGCRRPPAADRPTGHGRPESVRLGQAPPIDETTHFRPLGISEPAARGCPGRVEPKDSARAGGRRPACQLAAHTRSRR